MLWKPKTQLHNFDGLRFLKIKLLRHAQNFCARAEDEVQKVFTSEDFCRASVRVSRSKECAEDRSPQILFARAEVVVQKHT
ncbi:hypothetical protein L6452_40965 [Arctium lappa]|uniref:Uncharacterized protein n=1 Tax=Arctium lappa TaxID=4217 RepID=A0ACB8XSB1_ARCLA|nr:hypothetical protein L6452_40965 [Arctium lappa]